MSATTGARTTQAAAAVLSVVMSLLLCAGPARAASPRPLPDEESSVPPPTAVEGEPDPGGVALSILAAHCLPCHGPREGRGGKGGLRLDSAAGVRAGGEGGSVVVSGDPPSGALFARVLLPSTDLDAMPPEGERLADADVERLRAWVAAGLPEPLGVAAVAGREASRTVRLRALATGLGPAPQREVEAARAAGAHVTSALPGTALLELSFVVDRARVGEERLAVLAPLAPWLVAVDLAGTAVQDDDLRGLGGALRLERLDLGRTAVSDGGVAALTRLPALRSLVLFGTAVTDASLDALAAPGALPSLAEVYVADTGVTAPGLARLAGSRPTLRVHAAGVVEQVGADPAGSGGTESGARRR